jgi:hypothetical protein
MAQIDLSSRELADLATALDLWSNFMQTGQVTVSAADLAKIGDPKRRPKALTEEQMRKVVALADLRNKLLAADSAFKL